MSGTILDSLTDVLYLYLPRGEGPLREMKLYTKSSSERVIGALIHDVEKGIVDYKKGHLRYDNKDISFDELKMVYQEWLEEGKFPSSFTVYDAEDYSKSLVYLKFNEDQGSAVLSINKNGEGFRDPERVSGAVSPFIKEVPEGKNILERVVKRICLRD